MIFSGCPSVRCPCAWAARSLALSCSTRVSRRRFLRCVALSILSYSSRKSCEAISYSVARLILSFLSSLSRAFRSSSSLAFYFSSLFFAAASFRAAAFPVGAFRPGFRAAFPRVFLGVAEEGTGASRSSAVALALATGVEYDEEKGWKRRAERTMT